MEVETSKKELEKTSQTLVSVLVPFSDGYVVVSNGLVVEVLPYAPALSLEDAPPWVTGTLLWKTTKIPLVSPDALWGNADPKQVTYRRIVILHALSGQQLGAQARLSQPRLSYFGLLSTDVPLRRQLGRDELEPKRTLPPAGAAGHADIVEPSGRVLIPDFDWIEQALAQALRR